MPFMAADTEEGMVEILIPVSAAVLLSAATVCFLALCAFCQRKNRIPAQDGELPAEAAHLRETELSSFTGSVTNLQQLNRTNSRAKNPSPTSINIHCEDDGTVSSGSFVILPSRELPQPPSPDLLSLEQTYSNLTFPKEPEEVLYETVAVMEDEQEEPGPVADEAVANEGKEGDKAADGHPKVQKGKKKKSAEAEVRTKGAGKGEKQEEPNPIPKEAVAGEDNKDRKAVDGYTKVQKGKKKKKAAEPETRNKGAGKEDKRDEPSPVPDEAVAGENKEGRGAADEYAKVQKGKKKKKNSAELEMKTQGDLQESVPAATILSPPTVMVEEMYAVVCKDKKKKAKNCAVPGKNGRPQVEMSQGNCQAVSVAQESDGMAGHQSSLLQPHLIEPCYEPVCCESWVDVGKKETEEPAYETVETHWKKPRKKGKLTSNLAAENLYESIDTLAFQF